VGYAHPPPWAPNVPRPEYAGLLGLAIRRVRDTARTAGVVWFVLFAALSLPVVRPWRDGGGGIVPWAAAVIVPALVALALMFALHWVREGWGRYRVRPTVAYNEGWWWLEVDVRGVKGVAFFRCRVVDEDGTSTTHEFSQEGGRTIDRYPEDFDVTGTKGGRKQPWGHYQATWEVIQPGKRRKRATVEFDWHAFQLPTV
jgi:hypothetical protein